MVNCDKCGKAIPDDSIFCPYCGKKQGVLPKRHTRRANGTGSVYYDSRTKKWIAQKVTGKSYTEGMKVRFTYKRQRFKSKTDALKAVQDMESETGRPDFTLSYYYQTFVNGKFSSLSKTKQDAYKIAYSRLSALHGRKMKDLTINDLQTVLQGVCGSYYTAKDVRTLLNALFRLAAADDRTINQSLPSMLVIPKLEETQVEPFTEEEQLQLWISYESGNINAAAPLIMIYTGLMTGEMRQLRKDMIHLEDKEIVGVGLKTNERKKKSVLLPDDIIPVLEDLIAKTETDVLYPISKDRFYRQYYKTLKEAGITRELSPYSCRHTTATVLAVHENVAPQTLQRIMRWKSTKMMDRYVTPSDQDARKAVNKI